MGFSKNLVNKSGEVNNPEANGSRKAITLVFADTTSNTPDYIYHGDLSDEDLIDPPGYFTVITDGYYYDRYLDQAKYYNRRWSW